MANAPSQEQKAIKEIKAWVSPILAIAMWTLLYADIRELKSDVKELMQYKLILENVAKGKFSESILPKDRIPYKHEDIYCLDQQLHS